MRNVSMILIALTLFAGCVQTPKPLTSEDLEAVNNPSPEVLAKVDQYFEAVRDDNRSLEAMALKDGIPLSEEQTEMARALGVRHPERVRVLYIRGVLGNPENFFERLVTWDWYTLAAVAAGYGIVVEAEYEGETWILAHELVHTSQFERLGFDRMIRQMLIEYFALPGRLPPIEREAIQKSEAYMGEPSPKPYAF